MSFWNLHKKKLNQYSDLIVKFFMMRTCCLKIDDLNCIIFINNRVPSQKKISFLFSISIKSIICAHQSTSFIRNTQKEKNNHISISECRVTYSDAHTAVEKPRRKSFICFYFEEMMMTIENFMRSKKNEILFWLTVVLKSFHIKMSIILSFMRCEKVRVGIQIKNRFANALKETEK